MVSRPRRLVQLFAVLLATVGALPAPIALAGDGNAPVHGEAGDQVGNPSNGNGGNVNGNGNGNGGPDEPDEAGASDDAPEISDEDRALGAVSADVALPLTDILALARAQNDGEFIDAELIVIDGGLVYDVTILEEGGRLTHLYYAARTGRQVAH
jgi:hypothetical protein